MANRRDIIFFSIAALATLAAVWFFFSKMQEKKRAVRTDLYTLVAPGADVMLAVNRPATFARHILTKQRLHQAFATEIPDIYLSILRENPYLPALLFSFHPQGVVLYARADKEQVKQIEKNTLKKFFPSFAPRTQAEESIDFIFYPDTGNRFFGSYQHDGIWVASYSKKLLREAARTQLNHTNNLSAAQDRLRKTLDRNAPLNLMIQADSLNLYVTLDDSSQWRVRNRWLGADLFMNAGYLCYFGTLPYYADMDSLYAPLGDTLTRRLEQKFPQIHIKSQLKTEKDKVLYTGRCQ